MFLPALTALVIQGTAAITHVSEALLYVYFGVKRALRMSNMMSFAICYQSMNHLAS